MTKDSKPAVPFAVTRLPRWPSSAPVSPNAWMCDCGEHGFTDSHPACWLELEAHLSDTGHWHGEYYYYGCREQRTSIGITADPDGRFTHDLLDDRG